MRRTAVLIACLACASCGHSAAHPHTASTAPSAPAISGSLAPGTGAQVFAHSCQKCHSLIGNESAHKQGGDLLGYDMNRSQILTFTREMPTRPLTAAQLDAVVDYVLRAEQRAHRAGH